MFEITVDLFGKSFFIPETITMSALICIVLCITLVIVGRKIRKFNPAEESTGSVLVAQVIVEAIDNLVVGATSPRSRPFVPYLISITLFIFLSNIMGIFGFTSPTSDFNVTLALALITGASVQIVKFRHEKAKGYLKSFIEPYPALVPFNLLDIVIVPASLSLRLFGNVLAGGVILTLVNSALTGLAKMTLDPIGITTGIFAPFSVAASSILGGYFNLFSGSVQTLVFILLTTIFVYGE